MQCDFCTRKCAGSTWHIMAECPATPLLEARKTGSEQLQELASQVWRGVGVDGPNPEWEQEITMEGGEWRRPRDWPKGDPRAGNVANPWYGVFSASWLDRIIAHALPSQRVARVDAGKKALRALSSAAVKENKKKKSQICSASRRTSRWNWAVALSYVFTLQHPPTTIPQGVVGSEQLEQPIHSEVARNESARFLRRRKSPAARIEPPATCTATGALTIRLVHAT